MTTWVNAVEAKAVTDVDWHLRRGFTLRLTEFPSDVMVVALEAQNACEPVYVRDPRMCGLFAVTTATPDEIVLTLQRQMP